MEKIRHDAWAPPALSEKPSPAGKVEGLALSFASAVSGRVTSLSSIIALDNIIYVFGECRINGYTGGQLYMSRHRLSGERISVTHFHRKSGTTRFGCFGVEVLPNGNFLVPSSIFGHISGPHMMIMEVSPRGDIVRAKKVVYNGATGQLYTGLVRTQNPWQCLLVSYYGVAAFDASSFEFGGALINNASATFWGGYSGVDAGSLSSIYPVGAGNRMFVDAFQNILSIPNLSNTNMAVNAGTAASGKELFVRCGDYLFIGDSAGSTLKVEAINGDRWSNYSRGWGIMLRCPSHSPTSPQIVAMCEMDGKVYSLWGTQTGGRMFIIEIDPNVMASSFGASGWVEVAARAIYIGTGQPTPNNFMRINNNNGNLSLTVSSTLAGLEVGFLLDFDAIYRGVANGGGAAHAGIRYYPFRNAPGAYVSGTWVFEKTEMYLTFSTWTQVVFASPAALTVTTVTGTVEHVSNDLYSIDGFADASLADIVSCNIFDGSSA